MSSFSKFHCINNSDKWIVAVDDKYMELDSKDEALAIYNSVSSISNSSFGSMAILEPFQVQKKADWAGGELATEAIQAHAQKVNKDYIAKHEARQTEKCSDCCFISAKERLKEKREFADFFGFSK